MNIQFHVIDVLRTPDLEEYATKKSVTILKILSEKQEDIRVRIECSKDTHSNKSEGLFKTELDVHTPTESYRTTAHAENLYKTIDICVQEMQHVLRKSRGRKTTLWKRGAYAVKKMMRGFHS